MTYPTNFGKGTVNFPHMRSNFRIIWAVFMARLQTYSRYRGQVIMSVITPIMIAALPILMGEAIAGSPNNALQNFKDQTGSNGNYVGYMLIGALFFQLTSNTLWNFGFFIRREMQQGTLESLYTTPVDHVYFLIGTSLYVIVRNSVSFVLALFLGIIVFSLSLGDFMKPTLILAIIILLVGVFPLFGISLVFGAAVLRFKEVGSMVSLMQWVISFLIGVFYPVTLLPMALRVLSLSFPLTWVNNSIRTALFDAPAFFDFYTDIAIIFLFAFIVP
ncbi:MAG: ABC transporter permease, partial [Candidatus Hodarchaeales archaeon]